MTKLAVIINKDAKNAKKVNSYLKAFDEHNIKYQYYKVKSSKLEETIKDCVEKHPLLLVGGGDGTIRTAAQYCAYSPVILGVLPLGTLNHFAKELNLPLDCDSLINSLKEKKTIKIDLAEVNGAIFVNNSSLGFYPKFAKKRDYFTKSYNKWLSYLPSLIQTLKKHELFSLRVKTKTLDKTLKTSFLMISNNLYSYQFPATIIRKNFQNHTLGLYFLKEGRFRLAKLFSHFLTTTNHFEVVETKSEVKIEIEDKKEITISLDGDTIITTAPLIYKSLKKALTVLV